MAGERRRRNFLGQRSPPRRRSTDRPSAAGDGVGPGGHPHRVSDRSADGPSRAHGGEPAVLGHPTVIHHRRGGISAPAVSPRTRRAGSSGHGVPSGHRLSMGTPGGLPKLPVQPSAVAGQPALPAPFGGTARFHDRVGGGSDAYSWFLRRSRLSSV